MLTLILQTGGTFQVSILRVLHQVVLNVHLCNVDVCGNSQYEGVIIVCIVILHANVILRNGGCNPKIKLKKAPRI